MAKTKNGNTEEPLEKQLWKTADKLRKNMDAAEYKHIVLGLIFLKYISDAFEELYQSLVAQKAAKRLPGAGRAVNEDHGSSVAAPMVASFALAKEPAAAMK